jgi:imidazolonepropionase-like amidohydrolase
MRRTASIALIVALIVGAPAVVPGVFRAAEAQEAPYVYAIRGARIVPVSSAPIDNGTIVFRNGVIAAVGANVEVPPGAVVIEGKGLTVYPGLIDMGSTTGLEMPPVPRAENPRTTEDVERVKAAYLRRAQLRAADHLDPTASGLRRAAAAGITAVLATPSGDAIRGQSALILTALPEDQPQIGAVADPRKGALVVKTPVALHVSFPTRPGGGNAYPNSLMGVIAFVRQAFLDAQHRAALEAIPTAPRLPYDAALEAMRPALERQMPVAFEGAEAREILRGLEMARSFKLDPIVTNAREADQVASDLKSAGARVIFSLNFPTRPETLAPEADEPLRVLRDRANAPKAPAALAKAGVPFAFASSGLDDPKKFIQNAARTVQNGLPREDALRALTLRAATIAGVADRLGSLEAGKIASIVVTEGDLFDEKMSIRHVFVAGHPVDLQPAPSNTGTRRGQ